MLIDGAGALVTGGASGLGRGTAAALVAAGAHVVIVDLPSSPGEEIAASLGSGTRFVAADVTDPEQIQAAVDAVQLAAPLRVAVNCAGIARGVRTVGREGAHPLDVFEQVIRINLIGTFNVARLAAAALAANDPVDAPSPIGAPPTPERGVIVNTASVAAYDGQIGQAAYSA